MFKRTVMIILSIFMSFNIIIMGNTLNSDIKSYIGKNISTLGGEIKSLHKEGKIKIICEDQEIITDIFIRSKEIMIDGVKIGDKLATVYEVYPETWISQHEWGVAILSGKATSYGIVTQYIIFLSEDQEHISEIQLGYTANFARTKLPCSNKQADKLLQGVWKSRYGKIIEFNQSELKDNQLDTLYVSQRYIITSPNEMIVYRSLGNSTDKIRLRFWLVEDELYIFSIDEFGIPIRDTVEKFNRIK